MPIFQGATLTAFAFYGLHRDSTKLDPDELETLQRLCEWAAQVYAYREYALSGATPRRARVAPPIASPGEPFSQTHFPLP